jgi:uncharacterized protein with beta-barrel porin domain
MGRPSNAGGIGGRLCLLVASCSAAALLVVGSPSPAQAACYTGPFPFTNSGSLACITVDNTPVTGDVGNGSAGTITPGGSDGILVTNNSTITGQVFNAGTISGASNGIFVINGSVVTNGINNSGMITAGNGLVTSSSGNISGGVSNSGSIVAAGSGITVSAPTFSGGISNTGMISAALFDGITATIITSFSGGISNAGSVAANDFGIRLNNIGTFSGNVSNTGAISASIGISVDGGVNFSGGAIVNSGTITGTGGTAIDTHAATSSVTIDQAGGTINGAINLSGFADVLNISGGTINGNIVGIINTVGPTLFLDTINFNLGAGTFIYGAAFGFSDVSVAVNSGTVILNGANSDGPGNRISVNGGTLVIGDAAHPGATLNTFGANGVLVNNGGTLSGNGTVNSTSATSIFAGGTLAPGTPGGFGTLTLNAVAGGNALTFASGSLYGINIAPGAGNNSRTVVTNGIAVLNGNGTVVVTPRIGNYAAQVYQILVPMNGGLFTAGVNGAFAGLRVNGNFAGTMALDYTTNPGVVDLDVNGSALFTLPGSGGAGVNANTLPLNVNQRNVFNGLNNAILNNDTLPVEFGNLANLSGQNFLNALTALSGEDATGAQKGAFQLMTEFLGLMLDPTAGGAGGANGAGASQFAPQQDASLPTDVALAYAKALSQQPTAALSSFEQRWTAWGASFGGTSRTNGNAIIGSNDVRASDFGVGAGMEYRVTPDTTFGFALAGGGTNWNLAQGLGSGRSDSFQAGLYAKTHWGSAYLSGALAFADHWFTTDRTALADQLRATFTGQSYAGRLEGGYRYAVPVTGAIVGVTPYAALQAQNFRTPSYSESDLTGGGFGLSYAAMNATDSRAELGLRFDNLQIVDTMPLVLRGRLAWAHDWVTNPALGAVFQALPASNFTVNGAAPPKDSGLVTAAAELHVTSNWMVMAKFDGEFASGAQTYAGTGTLRYSW